MAISLDFGKFHQRVCAASACIATGAFAAATGDTTSTAGIVAGVLASVGSSVLASDIHGHLARRLGRAREVFRNHDLTLAVGRAIALVIDQTADDQRLQDAPKALNALSQKAPTHWETLSPLTATNETIAPLAETNLVHFIAVKADDLGSLTALEPDTWADVIGWMADLEKIDLRPGTILLLADRMHRCFPSALREVLKHDFSTDGRVYAGLEMLIWGELVGSLAEMRQKASELRADLQEALKFFLAEVVAAIEQLRADSQGDRRVMLDRMADLVGSLREDMLGGQEQILAGIEQVLERLAALPGQLQGRPAADASEIAAGSAPSLGVPTVPSAALPPPRNSRFVPRMDRGGDDILEALHAKPKTVHRVVLHGMPAVGKTQAVLEYAYRYSEERRHYSDVFWTVAETEDQLRAGLLGIAMRLGLPVDRPVAEVLNAVKAELEKRDGWLWVLDNALDVRMVTSYLPAPTTGRVLVTTTRPGPELHVLSALPVELTHFCNHADGARFLLTLAGLMERDRSLEVAYPDDVAAAQALSEEVGGLPLALDQAAAYIEATSGSPWEYLEQYRRRGEELRRLRTPIPGDDRDHANVTVTFAIIFEQIETERPATADLLRLLAFFAPNAIPEEILTAGAAVLGDRLGPAVSDNLPLTRMPALLARLLTRDPRTATLSVHRLVQDVLHDRMDGSSRISWAERAVRALNLAVPEVERLDLDQSERTLPHLRTCTRHIQRFKYGFPEAGRLLDKTGCQLYYLARYDESLVLLDQALAVTEAALGPNHPNTARTLNNKAFLLQKQMDFTNAESLFRRALAVREASLGTDHPDTGISLNNLGILLLDQEKYAEAEPFLRRGLAVSQASRGPNHPGTALSMNNLGELLRTRGRLEEAEPLIRRALAIREKYLRPNHPETASSLNNLASLLQNQGKPSEAEPLFRRALAIHEEGLGANHPETARSLNNLAGLLQAQGKLPDAELLYRRALAIHEEGLGPNHPETAAIVTNLAGLLRERGKLSEAEPLYHHAWTTLEKSHGPDHMRTKGVLLNYLIVLQHRGRRAELKSVLERLDPKRADAIKIELKRRG